MLTITPLDIDIVYKKISNTTFVKPLSLLVHTPDMYSVVTFIDRQIELK